VAISTALYTRYSVRAGLLVHRRIHSLSDSLQSEANECVKRCTSTSLFLVQFTTQTLDWRARRNSESSVRVTALAQERELMRLPDDLGQLSYCTNIHPGEGWTETYFFIS